MVQGVVGDGGTIETVTEKRLRTARLRIVRYPWKGPVELTGGYHDYYRVDWGMSGRPRNAQGRLGDRNCSNAFESIGEIFVLPPGAGIHTRGDCSKTSLVCEFETEAVDEWFEGELNWAQESLRGALNISNSDIRRAPRFDIKSLCHPQMTKWQR